MSHARIEEVSDSDSDPSEGNISDLEDDFDERDILKARPSQISTPKPNLGHKSTSQRLIDPSVIPAQRQNPLIAPDSTSFQTATDESKYKDFQCLYPVYFDKSRSRAEGRRVRKQDAVENPLAREIVAACGRLRLDTLFEPAKQHPKDWANPGRVKVKVKGANNPLVNNKHHLYMLVSKHLRENPATPETAVLVRVPGAPTPDPNKPYPTPAVPKGWKMGTILPYYSPALTGGGVSENFFKDMMAEMQGQIPGAAPPVTVTGGEAKKKKEKKKK